MRRYDRNQNETVPEMLRRLADNIEEQNLLLHNRNYRTRVEATVFVSHTVKGDPEEVSLLLASSVGFNAEDLKNMEFVIQDRLHVPEENTVH